jgi:hypothetical protein
MKLCSVIQDEFKETRVTRGNRRRAQTKNTHQHAKRERKEGDDYRKAPKTISLINSSKAKKYPCEQGRSGLDISESR